MAIGWQPGEPHKTRRSRRAWRGFLPSSSTVPVVPARRLIIGAVVTAGLVTVAVVGPSLVPDGVGSATSYAGSAIDIRQEGGQWVARIKDPLADHERYTEAFSAVGLKVELQPRPVSPTLVGDLVLTQGEDGTTPAGTFAGGREPVNCKIGEEGCYLAVRVPVGFKGEVRAQLGRPAEPGERYQAAASATDKGEVLEGVELDDRTVAEVLEEVRKRDVQVVYQMVKSDPDPSTVNWIDGKKGGFHLSYEPIASDAVGSDWLVWAAEPQSDGVVRLGVTPHPLEPVAPTSTDGTPGS
ncbi:hypothetical protein [Nonomuraea cavernae]|uniref:hypothetical protein n=1 Tax=Nonomuraea cavernae TaxID=2045107 RepID=UPI0033D3B822